MCICMYALHWDMYIHVNTHVHVHVHVHVLVGVCNLATTF